MQEVGTWKDAHIPAKGFFNSPTQEMMKYVSFPNVAVAPDTPFTYTDSDTDETVTWTYTPQAADIRDATAGSYWIRSDLNASSITNSDFGVFFLHYEISLCDMTTSAAGYTPLFTIDIKTVDPSSGTVVLADGHPLGKHLHTHYPGQCREVHGSRRKTKVKRDFSILNLKKCDECGQYIIDGKCLCLLFDGLRLEHKPDSKGEPDEDDDVEWRRVTDANELASETVDSIMSIRSDLHLPSFSQEEFLQLKTKPLAALISILHNLQKLRPSTPLPKKSSSLK